MAKSPSDRKTLRSAVALGYDPEKDPAPRILAAGRGELAGAILDQASRHQVPIVEQHPLAEALVRLQVGDCVPPELYAAVAEVLVFLWQTEQAQAKLQKGGGGV